jgi:trigger factor
MAIEVPLDEVTREWNGAVKEFQKFAQIPGFRPGRAPAQIVERRFQKEISEEVQRKLIPQSFREAIAKEKLDVVSMPKIEEVKFSRTEPLRFQATVDIAPEFALPEYKGLKVKKPSVELKDEEVESSLKLLAEQQARFEEVKDRELVMGDFAVVSYSGVCEGKPIAQIAASAANISENQNFWLLMAKDSFLPGFCDALAGAKIGEKKQVLVDFPADFRIKELGGKKATYFVDVHGIRERKVPPLNDELAKSYQAESLDDLRKRVKETMLKERERRSEAEVRNQILEQLRKATTFDLPESLVNEEAYHVATDIVRENQQRGVGEEILREKSKEIFDSASQSARDRVRTSFILGRIAKAEKVEVKEEEIMDLVREEAKRTGKSVDSIRQQLQENGGWESLRERLMFGRTLDLLVSHAIVEKSESDSATH